MEKKSIDNCDNLSKILSRIILFQDANNVILDYLKPHPCLNELENYFTKVLFSEKIKYMGNKDILEHRQIKGWYHQLWIRNDIEGIVTILEEYQFGHIQPNLDLEGDEIYYDEQLPYYDYQSSMREIDQNTQLWFKCENH